MVVFKLRNLVCTTVWSLRVQYLKRRPVPDSTSHWWGRSCPSATPEEMEDLTKTVIPLKITGPLTSPKVSFDVEELLRQRVEEEIKDKLEDKLKDLFKR